MVIANGLLLTISAQSRPAVLAITIPVALVLAALGFSLRTRKIAAVSLFAASLVFGVILWGISAIYTFNLWGWLGLLVECFLLGVGVVPTAYLALAINSDWGPVGDLTFLLEVGTRILVPHQTGRR